jgi:molybdenum cofactor cytidylyltransferase
MILLSIVEADALNFGIVILGAGQSKRMGKPKLLLPWGQTTVLGHLIEQWQEKRAGQIAVVCAVGDSAIQVEFVRLGLGPDKHIINFAPEGGMFSSVQIAAQWGGWKSELSHWGIVLGDQPHLSSATLERLVQFCTEHPSSICVPRQGGHRRHPVFLPKEAFLQLANSKATDLRQFLDRPPLKVEYCEMNDPALALDIDRPEDYEEAVRNYLREG